MKCSVTASNDGRYIILQGRGEIRRQDHKRVFVHLLAARELAASLGIRHFLLDMTAARNLQSPADDYEYVNQLLLQELRIDRFAILALLVSPEDHSQDFLEIVSRNAGITVQLFRDREEAIAFLTGDRPVREAATSRTGAAVFENQFPCEF